MSAFYPNGNGKIPQDYLAKQVQEQFPPEPASTPVAHVPRQAGRWLVVFRYL